MDFLGGSDIKAYLFAVFFDVLLSFVLDIVNVCLGILEFFFIIKIRLLEAQPQENLRYKVAVLIIVSVFSLISLAKKKKSPKSRRKSGGTECFGVIAEI